MSDLPCKIERMMVVEAHQKFGEISSAGILAMNTGKVFLYLNSLYDNKERGYRFNSDGNVVLLSSDFVLMTLFLLDNPEMKSEILADDLLKHKTETRSFFDLKFDETIDRAHKPDYVINQFTFFSLIVLDELGYHFDDLPFFDKYLNIDVMKQWFDSLKWNCFWYESNKIMFWMYFYSYIIKYGPQQKKQQAQECIEEAFNILNCKQDKKTGYWGTDLNNNNLVDGCFGAAHIFLFYDYFGKEIQYPDRIIDNTLSLHSDNGLILSAEGGACEDYDAVDIYFRLLKRTDHKRNDIYLRLEQMRNVIRKSQERDGGFAYKISQKKIGLFRKKKEDTYRYSSWELMNSRIYYSDTWGTYFRLLTIAAAEKMISGKSLYKSYSLPGWGYL